MMGVVYEILMRIVAVGLASSQVKITRSIMATAKSRVVGAKLNITFNGKSSDNSFRDVPSLDRLSYELVRGNKSHFVVYLVLVGTRVYTL